MIAAAQHLSTYYESLNRDALARLDSVFHEYARFRDPFNDVSGIDAIRALFERLFDNYDEAQFVVHERVCEADICYLHWTLVFQRGRARQCIDGVSRVRFTADGRVIDQQDFWDPAHQVYENYPLLGRVIRALRRRLGTPRPNAPR